MNECCKVRSWQLCAFEGRERVLAAFPYPRAQGMPEMRVFFSPPLETVQCAFPIKNMNCVYFPVPLSELLPFARLRSVN